MEASRDLGHGSRGIARMEHGVSHPMHGKIPRPLYSTTNCKTVSYNLG